MLFPLITNDGEIEEIEVEPGYEHYSRVKAVMVRPPLVNIPDKFSSPEFKSEREEFRRHSIGYCMDRARCVQVHIYVQVGFMKDLEGEEREKGIKDFVLLLSPWFFSYSERYINKLAKEFYDN